MIKGSQPFSDN
jgi:hypothetical protein